MAFFERALQFAHSAVAALVLVALLTLAHPQDIVAQDSCPSVCLHTSSCFASCTIGGAQTNCHAYLHGPGGCDNQCFGVCSSSTPCETPCNTTDGEPSTCGAPNNICNRGDSCNLVCNSGSSCEQPCTGADGVATSCGRQGTCRDACSLTCTYGVPCTHACNNSGASVTCGSSGFMCESPCSELCTPTTQCLVPCFQTSVGPSVCARFGECAESCSRLCTPTVGCSTLCYAAGSSSSCGVYAPSTCIPDKPGFAHADTGGRYEGRAMVAIDFNGSASTSPHGIRFYAWNFGDGSPTVSSELPQRSHTYRYDGVYDVTLTVGDSGTTLTDTAHTTAAIIAGGDRKFETTEQLSWNAQTGHLLANAAITLAPKEALRYRGVVHMTLTTPSGMQIDLGEADEQLEHVVAAPVAGRWELRLEYFWVSRSDSSDRAFVKTCFRSEVTGAPSPPSPGTGPPCVVECAVEIEGLGDVWFFRGVYPADPGDSQHPTFTELTANPQGSTCSWSVESGRDTLGIIPNGCQATVFALYAAPGGSPALVRVVVDGVPSQLKPVRVRTPWELVKLGGIDPEDLRYRQYPDEIGFASRYQYEPFDNSRQPVTNLLLMEVLALPAHREHDSYNWPEPLDTRNVSMSEYVWDSLCYSCDHADATTNCTPWAAWPRDAGWQDKVMDFQQTFYLGSRSNAGYFAPVQQDRVQYYRGCGRHESVSSPVP